MNTFLSVRKPQRWANMLATVALGLGLASLLLMLMGIQRPNAQILGVAIGPPKVQPERAVGNWDRVIDERAKEAGFTQWHYKPFARPVLSHSMQPPRWYLHAEIVGKAGDREASAVVDCVANAGGEWRLKQWSGP